MKIAFLTAHLSSVAGGFRFSVAGMARAAAQGGALEAHIVGVRDPREPDGWQDWTQPGLAIHALAQRGPLAFGYAPALRSRLRAIGPDLIHAQGLWMYPSLASLRCRRSSGPPYLIAPHGMLDPWALGRGRAKKRLAAVWFEDEHLKGAACLHALTTAEARAMRAYGLKNPICVIPNGVDLPPPTEVSRPGRERVVLFLGRIDPKKGVKELIQAWSLVRSEAERLGWRLEIVGWGEPAYVASVRRLSVDLGLDRIVTIAGPRFGRQKTETFSKAAAFVLPSYSEGLPMAVLEAWSHSLPVLMTRACNLPEGFAAGAAVRIATEPASIREGLATLLKMSGRERAAMGLAGRRLVESRFTWDQVAAELRQVYRWVLGGAQRPACLLGRP